MTTIRITSGRGAAETRELEGDLLIGRDPNAQLTLDDDLVSREHARISRGPGGGWVLRDLGSTNGTWVTPSRGRRRKVQGDHALQDGDLIEIGDTRIAYGREESAPTVLVPAPVERQVPAPPREPVYAPPPREPAAAAGGRRGGGVLLPILGIGVGAAIIAGIVGAIAFAGDGGGDCGRSEAVVKIRQSTALVVTLDEDGNPESQGSGFVLTADGNIMTNRHVVVDDAGETVPEVIVMIPGRSQQFTGNVTQVADSNFSARDVALIKLQGVSDLTPITSGNSTSLRAGDGIVAAGFPLVGAGDILDISEPTNTFGSVSQFRDDQGITIVQHTADIHGGNSGGPLVTECGEVVGINTFGLEVGGQDVSGLSFAIASSEARRLADQWIGR